MNVTNGKNIKLSTTKRLKLFGDSTKVDLYSIVDCTLDKSFVFGHLRYSRRAQLLESGSYLLDYRTLVIQENSLYIGMNFL